MKSRLIKRCTTGLMAILVLASCENEPDKLSSLITLKGTSGLSYNDSQSKWRELKTRNGNSYIYETTFSSWAGFGSTTELHVLDGIVTSRVYKEFKINGPNGQREVIDSYSETKVDLGGHEKGAKPLTIDELYSSCASEYLIVDTNNNTLYFETASNGLMTLCGFVPNGCADDCYRGIRISSFNWID